MRRLLLTILSVVTLLFAAAIAYGAWRNPENTTLDATARANGSGQFIALGDSACTPELPWHSGQFNS